MIKTTFEFTGISPIEEKLTIGRKSLKSSFNCFSGKSGDHWVSIIPSLNTSGYGNTEEEAMEDLKYNLDIFCKDLFQLSHTERILELKKLGWESEKYFPKRFSTTYIDENGVLQNFDSPEEVKKCVLETA